MTYAQMAMVATPIVLVVLAYLGLASLRADGVKIDMAAASLAQQKGQEKSTFDLTLTQAELFAAKERLAEAERYFEATNSELMRAAKKSIENDKAFVKLGAGSLSGLFSTQSVVRADTLPTGHYTFNLKKKEVVGQG